ncbi:hypothetical protein P9112_007648 [Eukaryota sp. TZLM1-RC]
MINHIKSSSLPLQICLYFNKWLLVTSLVSLLLLFFTSSVSQLQVHYVILRLVFVLLDTGRLLLGYHGNLKERLFTLSSFAVACVFPQILIMSFLTFFWYSSMPLFETVVLFLHFSSCVIGLILVLTQISSFYQHPSRRYKSVNLVFKSD